MRQPGSAITTRDRYLLAAAYHIANDGFAGASIGSIAETASVTKGALAHYFPSKATFVSAMTEAFIALVETSRREALLAYPDGSIRSMIWFILRTGTGIAEDPRAAAAAALPTDPSAPVEFTRQVHQAWEASIRQYLKQAQHNGEFRLTLPLDEAVAYLMVEISGVIVYGRLEKRPEHAPRMRFLRITLRALGLDNADEQVDAVVARAQRIGELQKVPRLGHIAQVPTYNGRPG